MSKSSVITLKLYFLKEAHIPKTIYQIINELDNISLTNKPNEQMSLQLKYITFNNLMTEGIINLAGDIDKKNKLYSIDKNKLLEYLFNEDSFIYFYAIMLKEMTDYVPKTIWKQRSIMGDIEKTIPKVLD